MKPIIDETFPFAQAREAFARMASGAHFGKVAIEIDHVAARSSTRSGG
jgi:NADPH:quinone reductase-like Zn-dependent oxidoreductase